MNGHMSSLYSWQDSTSQFLEACDQLELGELLHDEMFGLFEAMSAIEMMDPKMDAGMLCNRASSAPVTWQQSVDSGHVCLEGLAGDLDPGHVSRIIDQSLSCLVTWLEGHSLAQTVMTNFYLHNVDKIQCAVMRSVSVVSLKLVEIIKDIIGKAGVFEEEDFQPHTYGFRLCGDITDQRCVAGLREAEELLNKDVRRTKHKAGVERSEEQEQEHSDFVKLHARVRFLRLFYLSLSALYRGDTSDGVRLVTQCEEAWQGAARDSVGPESGDKALGFEPLANQRLLPPTFPRYTEIVSREKTVEYVDQLLSRLSVITSIVHITSFHSCLQFFQSFSSRSPCVLSRSLLQLLYTPLHYPASPRPGVSPAAGPPIPPSFPDMLRESCKQFMAPPCLLPPPKSGPGQVTSPVHSLQVKLLLDAFFSQCCRPFGLLIQASGHNRARQRDKISQVLEEFCSVQEEADRLDNMLNSLAAGSSRPHVLYLGTWLLYHVLKLMVSYILSGWELELYSSHEWSMMWWYLYELLYPWLINCLHRADTVLSEHLDNVDKDKKNKNKKKSKPANKKGVKPRPYMFEIAYYQAHISLCAGFYKLILAVKKEQKIMTPNPQFDNEQVRYEHRFAAFGSLLTPPLMPYSQYKVQDIITAPLTQKHHYLFS